MDAYSGRISHRKVRERERLGKYVKNASISK